MMQKILALFALFLSLTASAQITGNVTNPSNEPLPFVNIYIKGTSIGTTSNADGHYRLNAENTGDYVITFQFLGYQTKDVSVNVNELPFMLDVSLTEETTSLDEVIVDASINPADRIIREVIDHKEAVLEKRQAYTADFYSRGIWKVKNAPEKILGQELGDLGGGLDSTRTGIVYLSETISTIAYQAPDDFKEKITASKVSGDDNGFSFNSAQEADFSFYNNTLEINTQLVSPIASNAFNYYRYKLEGVFYEGNKLINKIEVIPRRANDRIFSGYIYVVEDDWQLYGVELNTTGTAIQVPFIEKLQFKHNFKYNEEEQLWIKISQTIDFGFKMLGFGGDGRFTAVYSNYDLHPNFERKEFTNEVLSFVPEANKKDSLYWQKVRPVPLTVEERADYVKKDSLQIIRKSQKYLDSVDGERNKLGILDPLLGYSYSNTYKRWRISYAGVLPELGFNTIQGWNSSAGLSFASWGEDYSSTFNAFVKANYGVDDDQLRFTGGISKRFNRFNYRTFSLTGGRTVQQFNAAQPISPLVNSIATLLWERNYLKAYDLTYARLGYSEELFNGFRFSSSLGYEKRDPLFNQSDQVFIKNDVSYTSNNPLAPADFSNAAITSHEIGKLALSARITFDQKYMSYPDGKFNMYDSKYPSLTVTAEQGFAASKSGLNYTQLRAGVSQRLDIGNKGSFGFNLNGGTFFNADNISFVDYQHFNGNQTRVNADANYLNSFNLMPYYQFSTNESYFEGHLEHNFKGYILGKIPGLRALNFNLVAGAHYLSTATNKPYSELSIGLDNLGIGKFRFLRIDYVKSYFNGGSDGAFMFGLSF